jgi:hypothetical protein
LTRISRRWLAFVILPLAGGIGLVVYLLAGISLRLGLSVAGGLGLSSTIIVWNRLGPAERIAARHRIAVGLAGGLIGTAAYDGLRYVLIKALHFKNWPFDVFYLFGQLLLGPQHSGRALWLAGTAFHIGCGMGFGAAYAFLFRRPAIWNALVWAAMLELFMITLYPGWLQLKALDELLTTSVLGHAAYGIGLGFVVPRYVKDTVCGIF